LPDNEIMRTNTGRFFDLMRASAAFYQFQREKDAEGNYITTAQDYELAREVFQYCFQEGAFPLTKNQKLLLKEMEDFGKEIDIPVTEIESKVTFLSRTALYTNLNMLAEAGFLKKCEFQKNFGTEERPALRDVLAYSNARTVESLNLPEWGKLIIVDLAEQALQALLPLQALQGLKHPSYSPYSPYSQKTHTVNSKELIICAVCKQEKSDCKVFGGKLICSDCHVEGDGA